MLWALHHSCLRYQNFPVQPAGAPRSSLGLAYFTDANPRPVRCSAHITTQSEEVYIMGVPAHSSSVYFVIDTSLDQLMLAAPQRRSLEVFTFPGALSLTDCYSHCCKPSVKYLCHSSHLLRGKRRWFKVGLRSIHPWTNECWRHHNEEV